MPNSYLSLNGPWKFRCFVNCDGEELGAYKSDYPDADWLLAMVPGTVHLDLIANKVIDDPFKDLNERKVQWVADAEWWYRKEVELTRRIFRRSMVKLIFEGLDTYATVWFNGVLVGEANNMFTPWQFNVSHAVKKGTNVVAVRFKPACQVARQLEHRFGGKYGSLHAENFSARPYVRKAQYSFGWDWAPILPTTGIWRNVRLAASDVAELGYISVLPLQVSAEKAKLKVIADVYSTQLNHVEAQFVLEGFGQRLEEHVNGEVDAGLNAIECKFVVSQPHLWWPNGLGKPNLYDCSVKLFHSSVLLDKASVRCGIRSVELEQKPDEEGKTFIFKINGLPIFCKGASWVPADSFLPRVTPDRYRCILKLAAEANFNMLRVWGGGVYEDDVFYELCDELGLMVWQDFMFTCSAYPEESWFLQNAEREACVAVRRLRGHPCIVVWCGNNEVQWQFKTLWKDMPRLFGQGIFEKILPSMLHKLDGTRPYRFSTPYSGGSEINSECGGSRHNWDVWSNQADYPSYFKDHGRFIAEFGWQAPAAYSLLKNYLGSSELHLNSAAVESHEKQDNGLDTLNRLLALHYPVPKNFKQWLLYAQLNQADALQTAITHWRCRMFKTSGCLIWQLNDCWPAISWSLIDYGLNPKPSYYAAKHVFQPVIAPLIVKDGKVYGYVVNDTERSLKLTFRFSVLSFRGRECYAENKCVVVDPRSSTLVLEHALEEIPIDEGCLFATSLESGKGILWEDVKAVGKPKNLQLPSPNIIVEVDEIDGYRFKITAQSSVYAKAVYLQANWLVPEFSDNFFDLAPSHQRTINCRFKGKTSVRDFEKTLTWQSYPYLPV